MLSFSFTSSDGRAKASVYTRIRREFPLERWRELRLSNCTLTSTGGNCNRAVGINRSFHYALQLHIW